MTIFSQLFRLDVSHEYYAEQPAPVKLSPAGFARGMSAAADFRLRLVEGRAEAICSADRSHLCDWEKTGLPALAASLEEDSRDRPHPDLPHVKAALSDWTENGLITFMFALEAADANLPYVTDTLGDVLPPGQVPVLDAATDDAPAVVSGAISLRPTGARAPFAAVRVRVDPAAQNARLNLRLAARAVPWTYHVMGGRDGTGMTIRDPASTVTFTRLDSKTTLGGHPARSFMSGTPIALSATPPQRFELIEDGPFGPKVILPVLPAPRPGPTAEIYVTLT